jgi:hypothetical protein
LARHVRLAGILIVAALLAAGCAHKGPDVPAGPAAGTGALPVPATQETQTLPALTHEEAIRASLGILTSHGLVPEAYFAATGSMKDAWLLAATHLSEGVVDPRTGRASTEPGARYEALFDEISPGSDPSEFSAALDQLAPRSSLYVTLKSALPSTDDTGNASRLQVSLERLRRLPRDTGERYLIANIPGYEVIAYDGAAEASRRPAIVGQPGRQTPEFSDSIEHVIFNPWWDVPASIAIRDKLPQFRRDPGAVSRLGYQIYSRDGERVDAAGIDWNTVPASPFPYRIRQAPGPANALGQVKFIFPNAYDVYLHDTPEKALFSQPERAFSSGCIRVSDPLGLAEWALSGTPGWDAEKIDATVRAGRESRINLSNPLPIHIVYLTAFPGPDGEIAFLNDVYGRDGPLLAAMTPFSGTGSADASLGRPLAALDASSINAGQPKKDTDHGDCLYRSS